MSISPWSWRVPIILGCIVVLQEKAGKYGMGNGVHRDARRGQNGTVSSAGKINVRQD
ncbi:MAG: hypothetical protein ABGX22_24370 [Pirellulaceae bacterium]|jgi:hypothetical protein